jgi:hypothetical protein
MPKPEKNFDAVAMMRTIRDRLSADIEGMSLEQERAWLESQEISDPILRRLRDGATQQSAAAAGASRRR